MFKMKKQTKCYIYTRVSTAIQVDGYSLDAQRDKLTKYAEYQDMEVVKEFSDAGHSGKNIEGSHVYQRENTGCGSKVKSTRQSKNE
jgi:site-specific DNA recombinase